MTIFGYKNIRKKGVRYVYTILVTNDNELFATQKQRIMQRSKLVNNLHFLVYPTYDSGTETFDMKEFNATMEYLLPVSKKYKTETLTLNNEEYETESGQFMLEYIVPFDTGLTAEAGDIEVQLTFTKLVLDEEGNDTQYVRKTNTAFITILPLTAWSDIVPDEALNSIDQRILRVQAQIDELADVAGTISISKADNITLTDTTLQLTANGEDIGNAIDLNDLGDTLTDATKEGLVKVVI